MKARIADHERDQELREDLCRKIDGLIRPGFLRDRKAELNILRSGRNVVAARHRSGKPCHVARKDASYRMEVVARKYGYRFVPPEVTSAIEQQLRSLYGDSYTEPLGS
jgi:hypothetical protein